MGINEIHTARFYILLTAHLVTILAKNQLDALSKCLFFQLSTCFEHHSAHHQEIELY